jgi:hypothetical protein
LASIPGLHKRLKIRALALKRNLLAVETALTTKYVFIKNTTVYVLSSELGLSQLWMKEERDNTWREGGLPTLPGLHLRTFQPSQRGFF